MIDSQVFVSNLRLIELVQLMSPMDKSKIDPNELVGRQSGSTAWRMARGEMGLGLESFTQNVWKLTDHEIESKTFHLEYNVVRNEYKRISNHDEVISGWEKGVCEAEDIMRKLEADWKQCYLARRGKMYGSTCFEATIWKLHFF